MTIKLIAISFGFIFSVLFLALSEWFIQEETKVEQINKQHLEDIQRLKKISKINKWLEAVVKPSLDALPTDIKSSDASLVDFFDTYSHQFNFKVDKYIYKDVNTYNLNIGFIVPRNNKDILESLMKLKYKKGFLRFSNFQLDENKIKGEIQVVQPFYKDTNASRH